MSGSDGPGGDETPGERRQSQGGRGSQPGGQPQSRQPQGQQTDYQGQQGQQTGHQGQQGQPRQAGYQGQQGQQYQYQQSGSTLGPEFAKYAKLGLGVHLTYGLGLALTIFLFLTLAPPETAQSLPFSGAGQGGATLFVSTIFALVLGIFFSAVPSLGVGFYIGQTAGDRASPPLLSAAVNVVGMVVASIILVVLALVFTPAGGGGGGGQLVGPLLGAAIAVAAVGAVAGFMGDRVDSW